VLLILQGISQALSSLSILLSAENDS